MKGVLLLCSLFFSFLSFSQSYINGIVQDRKGEPVFAANVYLKLFPQKGTTTDFEGKFSVPIESIIDTLIVSFIGYKTKEIPLSTIDTTHNIVVTLQDNSQTLEEVIITAQDPISERFSVVKMSKLNIYLNPVAQGDALKAITTLPASTTTDETANVSLRGSSPSRSRVILNGVPIYSPVRASDLNNQGFFSLFNTAIVKNQYVYASNPPLTYGNTSAGLVEIQTIKNLELNQLQLSAGLSNTGFFLSQKIKKQTFIQAYGNYQFSDAFVGIQKEKLPNTKTFYARDAGINFHAKMGKKAEFNSYNYFIDEQFDGDVEAFTYRGNVSSRKRRFFSVNNVKFYSEKGIVSINSGVDNATQNVRFGNIHSGQKTNQIYTSMDYKWQALESMTLQFGVSHDFHTNTFNDSIPEYYYALSPNSPSYFLETSIHNHILEAYAYMNWDRNEKFTFSFGNRSSIPTGNQNYYFSSQVGLKYRLHKRHSFLLSGGKYHNYSIPTIYSKEYNLLQSYQLALDYSYDAEKTSLTAAAYFKNETGGRLENETGGQFEKVNTFGLELYLEHVFCTYFTFSFANSFINQLMTIDKKQYNGSNDFNYLIKTTINYSNPKLFTLALTYIGRPGIYYTGITGGAFDDKTNFYEPIFATDLYNVQYESYNNFSINGSKYIRTKKQTFIIFAVVNNIFNIKNERTALYNTDYSNKHFDFYQFRTVYFGMVWQLNY